jgi:pyrimidine operon attenuation protein/uracil phosphoribosyltransferase
MNLPDANQLRDLLAEQMRTAIKPDTLIIGIHSGGAWVAEYLHRQLGLATPLGTLDVAFYRDDYASRGLHKSRKSTIPLDIEGRDVILVDDVLYSGRTTRAALNELFDYGRPARVDLAVLIDRGDRQLPIAARFCAHTLTEPLPAECKLSLQRDEQGNFSLEVKSA